jgi:uncharacterized coiled-coil DUF342 family protein
VTEERIQALSNLTTQHSQELQGIYVAFREIRDTMQVFATAIVEQRTQINQNTENLAQLTVDLSELKMAVALQSENLRSIGSSVERVNNTVEVLATEAAQDRAAIREMQAEVRQIWEYLMTQRGNGR